jgi:transformation/transcription domain-associated protein
VVTILNFLVRLKMLLADSKMEGSLATTDVRATSLLRLVLRRWPKNEIKAIYFEKVVAMCAEETASIKKLRSAADSRAHERARGRSGKASKSTRTPSGKDPEAKSVSTLLLSACLDVFNLLVEEAVDNRFFAENSDKVAIILGPCFGRVRQRGCGFIRRKLKRFAVAVMTKKSLPLLDRDGVLKFRALLESLILEGITFDAETHGAALGESSGGFRGFPSDEGKVGGSCIAFFSVDVISEISRTAPGFIEPFAGSLVSLASKLCSSHIEARSSSHRPVSHSAHQVGSSAYQVLKFTQVAGIMDEAKAIAESPPETSASSQQAEASDFNAGELGTSLLSLLLSIRLVAESQVPFSFTGTRKNFFQTLSTIIDRSDNVQLIMSAVTTVSGWVIFESGRCPMTLKEKSAFLWKLASFDFCELSDIASQPLADLVACLILKIHGEKSKHSEPNESFVVQDGRPRFSESEDVLLGRCLSACLMTPNRHIRSRIMNLYAAQHGQLVDDSPQMAVKDRSPFDLLWQLCHTDFEGTSARLWTVVFAEVLLANSTSRWDEDQFSQDWLPAPLLKDSDSVESALVEEYRRFCKSIVHEESSQKGDHRKIIPAIAVLASRDYYVCQELIERLLPAAWACIPSKNGRLALASALGSLLARPYHSQSVDCAITSAEDGNKVCHTTNSVKSLLRAISALKPLPYLDAGLLLSVAENYNAWHEVLGLLEDQHLVLSSNVLSDAGRRAEDKIAAAIHSCYQQIGEHRLALNLASRSCSLPESKQAISLDVHGMVKEALNAYSDLMERFDSLEETDNIATDPEMDLWENRWVDLQKELCQLQVVADYAAASGDPHLLLESSWKLQDWEQLRSLCASPSLAGPMERGDPTVKMTEILLAVNEGKLSEVENLHAQTAQLSLQRWQLLPALAPGSQAHCNLLHFFHRLVELRESGQIMVETGKHSSRRTLPDLKNLLT